MAHKITLAYAAERLQKGVHELATGLGPIAERVEAAKQEIDYLDPDGDFVAGHQFEPYLSDECVDLLRELVNTSPHLNIEKSCSDYADLVLSLTARVDDELRRA